jgi:hypothetical protein
MNSFATYQDSTTAWLSSEGVLSWVTSTVYERFSGGGYMSGIKLVRGCSELGKVKDKDIKRPLTPTESSSTQDEKQQRLLKRRSAPPSTKSSQDEQPKQDSVIPKDTEPPQIRLQRQLSSLMDGAESRNPEDREEQIRQREEKEIQDDYTGQDGETQGREIEHLVLVTHGIGQLLGLRYVNRLDPTGPRDKSG